jgi:hypothetical protein
MLYYFGPSSVSDAGRPQLGNANLLRGLGLACLVAARGLSPAAGQEARQAERPPLEASLAAGIGFETETGESGAIVLRELLSAAEGRLSAAADISSALGVAPGNYSALIDSAGLHVAYRLFGPGPTGISLDSHLRYRELFEDARELRFGGRVVGRWGGDIESKGIFGDWALGFEGIRTAIDGLPTALWEGNPLIRVDAGWRFSSRWTVDAAVESNSDEDASYSFRTLFDFGSSVDLAALSLRCRLMIKYSDFFTPTGYIDGFAFRVAVTIPLKGP